MENGHVYYLIRARVRDANTGVVSPHFAVVRGEDAAENRASWILNNMICVGAAELWEIGDQKAAVGLAANLAETVYGHMKGGE